MWRSSSCFCRSRREGRVLPVKTFKYSTHFFSSFFLIRTTFDRTNRRRRRQIFDKDTQVNWGEFRKAASHKNKKKNTSAGFQFTQWRRSELTLLSDVQCNFHFGNVESCDVVRRINVWSSWQEPRAPGPRETSGAASILNQTGVKQVYCHSSLEAQWNKWNHFSFFFFFTFYAS